MAVLTMAMYVVINTSILAQRLTFLGRQGRLHIFFYTRHQLFQNKAQGSRPPLLVLTFVSRGKKSKKKKPCD